MTDLGSLWTLGYQGLTSSADLREILDGTSVGTIVDVRLSPRSGNRAFSTDTRATVEAAGLRYVHEKGLGNLGYKRGTIEIADISRIETVLAILRAGKSVALLCVCPQPEDCHRLTLCEEAVRREPGLQVVHIAQDRIRRPAAFLSVDATDEQLEAFVDALLPPASGSPAGGATLPAGPRRSRTPPASEAWQRSDRTAEPPSRPMARPSTTPPDRR